MNCSKTSKRAKDMLQVWVGKKVFYSYCVQNVLVFQ